MEKHGDSGRGDRFITTRWSEVARAAAANPAVKREALGRLLSQYLPVFRTHLIAHRRLPPDQVEDIVQGFVCDRVVADDLIVRADKQRGKLRTFLLVSLDKYLAKVARSQRAAKRQPLQPILDIGVDEPPAPDAADQFDLAWARELVDRAIREMRRRCSAPRYRAVWRVFEAAVLGPLLHEIEPPGNRLLAKELGFASPQQVSNTLVTAKRMFARALREIISEYTADEKGVDEEINDLWRILASARAHE